MAGVHTPDAGTIEIEGRPVRSLRRVKGAGAAHRHRSSRYQPGSDDERGRKSLLLMKAWTYGFGFINKMMLCCVKKSLLEKYEIGVDPDERRRLAAERPEEEGADRQGGEPESKKF